MGAKLSTKKGSLTSPVSEPRRAGDRIRTGDVQLGNRPGADPNEMTNQHVASPHSAACTSACTNDEKNVRRGNIEALAAALRALSAEERGRLLALLGSEGNADNG
jgi:hypothetical protein